MNILQENDYLKFTAEQDLVVTYATACLPKLQHHLQASKSGHVILDLSLIELLDSIGVKLIVGLYKTCQEKGIQLEVEATSNNILKILKLCALDRLIPIRSV